MSFPLFVVGVVVVVVDRRAEHLPKSGVLNVDPFFQLRRSVEGVAEKQWPAVAASEVVHHSRDPVWAPLRIGMSELANNDRARTILVEIFDKVCDRGSVRILCVVVAVEYV